MLGMVLPVALIVISNCFYNIITKQTPNHANAFLSLGITYTTAAIISFVVFFASRSDDAVSVELKKLNWTSAALGLAIIGLELGYILAYRAGWNINMAPLIANTCLAVALVFIGFFVFRETITAKQIIGMAICIVGLIIVSI